MDESGDLGFDFSKPKTSKYFIVAFLFAKDKKQIDKIVKKIFTSFTQKQVKNHSGVLHSYKETPATRKRLLQLLAEKDVHILTIRLNKQKVYAHLKDQKHILYNYVVNILLGRLISKKLVPLDEIIHFIASRRETSRFLNDNFTAYLRKQTKSNHKLEMDIKIMVPSQEKGLQVADFIAWSFFRKYEHSDDSYADIVNQKVVEENVLYK